MSTSLIHAASSWKTRLIKRIVPMMIMGVVLALLADKFSRAIPSDIDVSLYIEPEFQDRIRRLELVVSEANSQDMVTTVFFRPGHTDTIAQRLKHPLRLLHGDYQLLFRMDLNDSSPQLIVRRTLTVTSDSALTISLP